MNHNFPGPERRRFPRLDYVTPLAYKICKKETIDRLLDGYTTNVSQAGLMCTIKDKVHEEDILWLSFDRDTLTICHDMEKDSLIYQSGVIGKVMRIKHHDDGSYSVGIQFITRQETHVPFVKPQI